MEKYRSSIEENMRNINNKIHLKIQLWSIIIKIMMFVRLCWKEKSSDGDLQIKAIALICKIIFNSSCKLNIGNEILMHCLLK